MKRRAYLRAAVLRDSTGYDFTTLSGKGGEVHNYHRAKKESRRYRTDVIAGQN